MLADRQFLQTGWARRPASPQPRSVVELMRLGMIDAELAATVWLLLESHVPVVVAALHGGVGKTTLLGALLDFVPPPVRTIELAGSAETFDWMPQATELGWARRSRAQVRPVDGTPVRPEHTILLASELSNHLPIYTWGDEARLAVRAVSIGYGLAATIHADSLEDVFHTLRRPPVGLVDDELSRLGVVLVLRRDATGTRRIVAAHYVRPTARDEHGHIQRLGPAVLATWNAAEAQFEHFGWGVTPELALRIGRKAGDVEAEVDRRGAFLDDLARAGVEDVDAVRDAIAECRAQEPSPMTASSGPH